MHHTNKSHLLLISHTAHKNLLRLCSLPKPLTAPSITGNDMEPFHLFPNPTTLGKTEPVFLLSFFLSFPCTPSDTSYKGKSIEGGCQPALKLPYVLPRCLVPPPGSDDLLITCSLLRFLAVKGQKYLKDL